MIRLENVSKYYYNSSNVSCALRKINLNFKMGEFVAVTGESGSGKTTLLNIISGFDSYEDGEIYVNGKPTSYFDEEDFENYRKNEISFIFQNYNLIDSYSVIENVMVTYIIAGVPYDTAKEKALEILKKVGLDGDVNKKTTKLSGGQKQRLAIARALAKETNIIVADEPTGNLDDENAKAILEILKELSKDKLVIIVSHNLAQVEPYITRKIRLHDGEVVNDELINEPKNIVPVETDKELSKDRNKVLNFSYLNFKAQPVRTLLLFMIVLISVLSSFIFIVNFKANLNDAKTKVLDDELFINFDDTRLLIRTLEQDVITDDIMNGAMVDKVVSVEKYDYITDVNYFRPTDYKYVIENGYLDDMDPVTVDLSYYRLQDFTRFMRSACSLSDSDLAYGRLPENPYEMVVYASDDGLLDTIETVMFNDQRKWNAGVMFKYELKIVGILKEPTEQAYFSEKLCQLIDLLQYKYRITVNYQVKGAGGAYKHQRFHFDEIVLDPNIGEYDCSFSKALFNDACSYLFSSGTNSNLSFGYYSYDLKLKFNQENCHNIHNNALGVSEDLFDVIYSFVKEKKQFAVFIEDYAYYNDVKKDLLDNGYDSLSCFESSTKGYDESKVIIRYVNLAISIVAFIVVNIVGVILLFTILKFRKNDYLIFKMNGMSNNLCKKINIFEIFIYGVISYILVIVLVLLVFGLTKNEVLLDAYKYVRFYDYLILLLSTGVLVLFTSRLFSKFLEKRVKISSISED